MPEVEVYPIFIEASDKTRLLRQLNREKDPDVKEIVRRFHADEEDFNDAVMQEINC
jgi:guanylate kinase